MQKQLIIDKRMTLHTVGIALFSFFVIYSGAFVRHMESSMVCKVGRFAK